MDSICWMQIGTGNEYMQSSRVLATGYWNGTRHRADARYQYSISCIINKYSTSLSILVFFNSTHNHPHNNNTNASIVTLENISTIKDRAKRREKKWQVKQHRKHCLAWWRGQIISQHTTPTIHNISAPSTTNGRDTYGLLGHWMWWISVGWRSNTSARRNTMDIG